MIWKRRRTNDKIIKLLWKNVHFWEQKILIISNVLVRLKSPSLPSPFLFFELQTSPQSLHHSKSSRFSGVIYVTPTLPIYKKTHPLFLVLTYPTQLVFVFSYNQLNSLLVSLQLVLSHPTSIFVFFFYQLLLPLSKVTLTIGHPNFTLNLQYISPICFLTAYFLSFSTSLTKRVFSSFMWLRLALYIIKIYKINFDG